MAFKTVTLTPTLSTDAYADGDVLFNEEIMLPARGAKLIGGWMIDQTNKLTAEKVSLFFFGRNDNGFGTVNASAYIIKANFRTNQFQGAVNVADSAYSSLGFSDIDNAPTFRPFVIYNDADPTTDGTNDAVDVYGPVLSSVETGGKIYVSGIIHATDDTFAAMAADELDFVFYFEY